MSSTNKRLIEAGLRLKASPRPDAIEIPSEHPYLESTGPPLAARACTMVLKPRLRPFLCAWRWQNWRFARVRLACPTVRLLMRGRGPNLSNRWCTAVVYRLGRKVAVS